MRPSKNKRYFETSHPRDLLKQSNMQIHLNIEIQKFHNMKYFRFLIRWSSLIKFLGLKPLDVPIQLKKFSSSKVVNRKKEWDITLRGENWFPTDGLTGSSVICEISNDTQSI